MQCNFLRKITTDWNKAVEVVRGKERYFITPPVITEMVKKMAILGGHTHPNFSPNEDSFHFTKFKDRISLLKMNCKMLTTKMQLCAQLMYSSSLKSSRPMNWSRNKGKDIQNFGRENFLPYQCKVLRKLCKCKWCFKNLSAWSLKWDNDTVSINCYLLLNHLVGHSSSSLKTGEKCSNWLRKHWKL